MCIYRCICIHIFINIICSNLGGFEQPQYPLRSQNWMSMASENLTVKKILLKHVTPASFLFLMQREK